MQGKKYFKRIVGAVVAVLALACVFAFAGCADDNDGNGTQNEQGEFYSLQQAYDSHFISLEDLKNIAYYRNGGTQYNEEIMADFTPAEKVALSEETQTAIKQSRAKALREEKRPDGTPLVAERTRVPNT